MKTAAFVLGLISGIIGLGLAFVTLFMGGLVSALSSDQSVGIMGIFAILLTLLIIVFSSIILAKPKQSGILLIGTSIGCIVSGGTLVAITSVLSLVAGILAYISGRKFNGITPPIKKSYVAWVISVLLAVIPISIVSKTAFLAKAPSIDLTTAKVANISSSGTLYEAFNIGSNSTDVQRQDLTNQITGKVIEWTLPVYEVDKDGDTFTVQTSTTNNDIGTFIKIKPRSAAEVQYLTGLKTDDTISIRGYITGVSLRSVNIEPAILTSTAISPVNQTDDSNNASGTTSADSNSTQNNTQKDLTYSRPFQSKDFSNCETSIDFVKTNDSLTIHGIDQVGDPNGNYASLSSYSPDGAQLTLSKINDNKYSYEDGTGCKVIINYSTGNSFDLQISDKCYYDDKATIFRGLDQTVINGVYTKGE